MVSLSNHGWRVPFALRQAQDEVTAGGARRSRYCGVMYLMAAPETAPPITQGMPT
jgi:hypothetical protein